MELRPIPEPDLASHRPDGRRQSPRLPVALFCSLRIGSGAWRAVRIDDLSPHGFRIGWVPQCSVGRKIWMRLPGLEPLVATVRWKDTRGVGCQFERPLHPIVVEHIAQQP